MPSQDSRNRTYEPSSRRSFLKTLACVTIAAPVASRFPREARATAGFDPSFGTASEALRALLGGAISSQELTAHVFQRIRKHNPKVNAFVTLLEEQAIQKAREADEARAAGKSWGRLHGLPILIKDTFSTAGVRTTSGSKTLENYVPRQDAVAVARLKGAGAILIGKTNLPEFASDLQSYNAVAGTTNNPWDVGRTPGGSTGGGAAALAAGFGFLELGSDIGGSIRTPSHFCGIYGHKPSLGIVPQAGHIPPPPGQLMAVEDLPVAGPMARSAQDLLLELEVIGGPSPEDAIAYRWQLPPARGARLKDYKIGFVLDDSFCPLSADVAAVVSNGIDALRRTGAALTEGWPKGIQPQQMSDHYLSLLASFFSVSFPESEKNLMRSLLDSAAGHYAKIWLDGVTSSHKDWLAKTEQRLKIRRTWQDYFKSFDAFLMPENIVPAFPHDHAKTFFERTIQTSQGKRPYADMLRWISFATLSGCPATVAPFGKTREGLPVGIQIVGPFLEDATSIHLAGLLADIVGGFTVPAGFST